ncbi:hypothetical protein HDV00_001924 [Rhizophlyctis rosea]|nr:hypothetical protein HDV00_001924 [Rhizophlyctis rosea]
MSPNRHWGTHTWYPHKSLFLKSHPTETPKPEKKIELGTPLAIKLAVEPTPTAAPEKHHAGHPQFVDKSDKTEVGTPLQIKPTNIHHFNHHKGHTFATHKTITHKALPTHSTKTHKAAAIHVTHPKAAAPPSHNTAAAAHVTHTARPKETHPPAHAAAAAHIVHPTHPTAGAPPSHHTATHTVHLAPTAIPEKPAVHVLAADATIIQPTEQSGVSFATPFAVVFVIGALLAVGLFVMKKRRSGGFLPTHRSDPSSQSPASIKERLRAIPAFQYMLPNDNTSRRSMYSSRYEQADVSARGQSVNEFLQVEKELDIDEHDEVEPMNASAPEMSDLNDSDVDATNNRLSFIRKYTPSTPSPLATSAPIVAPTAPVQDELAPPPLMPTVNTNGAGDVIYLPQPAPENHRLSMKAFTAYNVQLESRAAGEWSSPQREEVSRERGPGEYERVEEEPKEKMVDGVLVLA